MSKISLALKVLFNGEFASKVQQLLTNDQPAVEHQETPPEPVAPKPARSEAVTLLSALQREARLVDFLMEKLDDYSDAQVGAAVRDIHRDSQAVVNRLFAPQAVVDQEEGSTLELSPGDQARIRRTGTGDLEKATSGQLVHHGWQVTKCDLPKWTGADAAALVVAPAEVEIR